MSWAAVSVCGNSIIGDCAEALWNSKIDAITNESVVGKIRQTLTGWLAVTFGVRFIDMFELNGKSQKNSAQAQKAVSVSRGSN